MIRIGYSNSAEFTSREFDIIRELAQGRKYEEIAADLDITLIQSSTTSRIFCRKRATRTPYN